MNDAEKREITKGLAKWMGFDTTRGPNGEVAVRHEWLGMVWDPFTNYGIAPVLLEECERRGLMLAVANVVIEQRDVVGCNGNEGMIQGLLSTPEQITLAVWEVVKKETGRCDRCRNWIPHIRKVFEKPAYGDCRVSSLNKVKVFVARETCSRFHEKASQ